MASSPGGAQRSAPGLCACWPLVLSLYFLNQTGKWKRAYWVSKERFLSANVKAGRWHKISLFRRINVFTKESKYYV